MSCDAWLTLGAVLFIFVAPVANLAPVDLVFLAGAAERFVPGAPMMLPLWAVAITLPPLLALLTPPNTPQVRSACEGGRMQHTSPKRQRGIAS